MFSRSDEVCAGVPTGTSIRTADRAHCGRCQAGHGWKANAKLKLVAGILGINFDELKRREEQRHRREQRIVISVSAALVLTFASLAQLPSGNAASQTKKH